MDFSGLIKPFGTLDQMRSRACLFLFDSFHRVGIPLPILHYLYKQNRASFCPGLLSLIKYFGEFPLYFSDKQNWD